MVVEILEERNDLDQINTVSNLANELFDENGRLMSGDGGTSGDEIMLTEDNDSQVCI